MLLKRNCRYCYQKRLLLKWLRLVVVIDDNQILLELCLIRSKGSVVVIESEDVVIVFGNLFLIDVFVLDIQLDISIVVEN